jgi:hypothetical protein
MPPGLAKRLDALEARAAERRGPRLEVVGVVHELVRPAEVLPEAPDPIVACDLERSPRPPARRTRRRRRTARSSCDGRGGAPNRGCRRPARCRSPARRTSRRNRTPCPSSRRGRRRPGSARFARPPGRGARSRRGSLPLVPSRRCVAGSPRRSAESSMQGRSSRTSDAVCVSSTAIAASTAASMSPPAASATASASIGRHRRPPAPARPVRPPPTSETGPRGPGTSAAASAIAASTSGRARATKAAEAAGTGGREGAGGEIHARASPVRCPMFFQKILAWASGRAFTSCFRM